VNDQVHGNLSEEPNSFIGRELELTELRRLIGSARALTLCGPGGIGKTRLALRMLAALADDYPDGVWFVELADLRQPELVVSRICSVLGVTEEPGRPLVETLEYALRSRRVLLGLDNCEHLIGSCAWVCQRLLAGAPELRVVATSREPLRVAAETVWQVPPLSVPVEASTESIRCFEAVRLFADRAAAAHPGFDVDQANAAAVAAICRALDGLPLAIELAAPWVRVLSVEQIAARLGDRFQLLTSDDRTAPHRQRTQRAAIDWSYDLLTEPERVLLRRLSVFVGWSLEMAEQVCASADLPADEILDLLTALVDKSLVAVDGEVVGQTRYRMLATIRDYAASRLAEATEAAATQQRLCDYALAFAEHSMLVGMAMVTAPWSARVDVFRRFDADADNLRQVLRWCLETGDAESGLRICTAVRPCWIVRGLFAEGAEWFDSFLRLDEAEVADAVRGPALAGRAQLALASDPAEAERYAMAALELCWAAGAEFWTAATLNLLTEIALHSGRTAEAVSRAEEALTIARKTRDRWNEGYALGTQAAAVAGRGNLAAAQQLGEAALVIMRELDQLWGVARTLLGLGDLARLTGEFDRARQRYAEALGALRQLHSRPEIARCLVGLGRIAMDTGDLALARQYLAESLELSDLTGSRIGVVRGLEAFAALAIREDWPDRAVQLTAAAGALRTAAHLPEPPRARVQRILDAAAGLGEHAIDRLWAAGGSMGSAAAVALALAAPPPPAAATDVLHREVAGSCRQAAPAAQKPQAAGHIRPTGQVPAPGRLTPRERQVVALIAEGCTNKAIAQRLYISQATAARHVANILAKLGFTSRAQIAAWAPAGAEVSVRRTGR
jgi:predicted ATPase/DNA-binding CsgD family transcriptional regulator